MDPTDAAHDAPLRERLAATVGDGLRIERELGGGGMSRVFLATDLGLGRQIVIKVLAAAGGVSVERFRQEMLVSAALHHPHIVPVLAAGVVDGLPWYSMPYIDGRSLRDRLAAEGALPLREAMRILRDVARACAHAHAQGIVHRDIKPENILLAGDAAMIIDFGIAKALVASVDAGPATPGLTHIGFTLGTPTYMAPEQAAADPTLDHRADLYALGIVAYELVAGRPPFQGATSQEILKAHLADPVPPLTALRADAPGGLVALIGECLAKSPASRPASADLLVERLEGLLGGSGTGERAALMPRAPWLRPVAVAAGLAIIGAFAWSIAQRRASPAAGGASDAAQQSLAVLPFVPRGDDSASTWLAEGLTDDLTAQLGAMPGLRTASRMSVERLGRSSQSPAQLAETLGVKTLLDGVVRREGNDLRIIAQLVEGKTGKVLWSGTFRSEPDKAGSIVDEVLASVRDALLPSASASTPEAGSRAARDPAAYAEYLRGRALAAARRDTAIVQAVAAYESAIRRDSSFAEAWTGLAQALMLLPLYAGVPSADVIGPAGKALDRALALNPDDPEAMLGRGLLRRSLWQWPEAEADLRRAVTLSGGAPAHQALGELLLVRGATAPALEQFTAAVRAEPASPIPWSLVGLAQAMLGRAPEANAAMAKAVAADSTLPTVHFLAGASQLYLNRTADALQSLRRAARMAPQQPLLIGVLAQAMARGGDMAGARRERDKLVAMGNRAGAAGGLMHAALALGDVAGAVAALDRAAKERDPIFTSEPLTTSLFHPLVILPRAKEILRRVGLADAVEPNRGS